MPVRIETGEMRTLIRFLKRVVEFLLMIVVILTRFFSGYKRNFAFTVAALLFVATWAVSRVEV